MKKITIITSCLAMSLCFSTAFANIKVAALPEQPYNGKDYVANIVAANYDVKNNNEPSILIVTSGDEKNNQSNLKGLAINVNEKDLPFGLTLANSVGKKIAVSFANENYDISLVQIITDEYWNSSNNKK